jgi:hypothetical protein
MAIHGGAGAFGTGKIGPARCFDYLGGAAGAGYRLRCPHQQAQLVSRHLSQLAKQLLERTPSHAAGPWWQDEDSCVVYGMPKEAVKRGAVERSIALREIGRAIL